MGIEAADNFKTDQYALLVTCRQINTEAEPIFSYIAPSVARAINISIHNFEFSPLINFPSSLSKEQLGAYDREQPLHINITIDDDVPANRDGLASWLRFAGFTLGGATTTKAYEFNGDILGPKHGWDAGFTDIFLIQDRSSFKAYQGGWLAKQEWERVKVACGQRLHHMRKEAEKKRWEGMTDEVRRRMVERETAAWRARMVSHDDNDDDDDDEDYVPEDELESVDAGAGISGAQLMLLNIGRRGGDRC